MISDFTKGHRIILLFFIVVYFALGMENYMDQQKKKDKKFEHKYIAGECLQFHVRDQNFEKNSRGYIIGQLRVEYVRYGQHGAYYGLRQISTRSWRNPKYESKNPHDVGSMLASDLDNFWWISKFAYNEVISGEGTAKRNTKRGEVECIWDWNN